MSERTHERYMQRAIELAAHVPDLPFGAVIVDHNRDVLLAEGWNKTSGNPIWHGEIVAINQLVGSHDNFDAKSLEAVAKPGCACS